jgi:hypothetical protein
VRAQFSKADVRAICLILAAALLLGSIPLTADAVATPTGHPEFTVNICWHPQTLDSASGTLLARPAPAVTTFVLLASNWSAPAIEVQRDDYRVAPETPPPKTPV